MEMVAANLRDPQKVGGLAGGLRAHSVSKSEPRDISGSTSEHPRRGRVSGCEGYNSHRIMGRKVHVV